MKTTSTDAVMTIESLMETHRFTLEQMKLLLQPSIAPEDYYQDGEITSRQALFNWVAKLKKAGVSQRDIAKAIVILGLY